MGSIRHRRRTASRSARQNCSDRMHRSVERLPRWPPRPRLRAGASLGRQQLALRERGRSRMALRSRAGRMRRPRRRSCRPSWRRAYATGSVLLGARRPAARPRADATGCCRPRAQHTRACAEPNRTFGRPRCSTASIGSASNGAASHFPHKHLGTPSSAAREATAAARQRTACR